MSVNNTTTTGNADDDDRESQQGDDDTTKDGQEPSDAATTPSGYSERFDKISARNREAYDSLVPPREEHCERIQRGTWIRFVDLLTALTRVLQKNLKKADGKVTALGRKLSRTMISVL